MPADRLHGCRLDAPALSFDKTGIPPASFAHRVRRGALVRGLRVRRRERARRHAPNSATSACRSDAAEGARVAAASQLSPSLGLRPALRARRLRHLEECGATEVFAFDRPDPKTLVREVL